MWIQSVELFERRELLMNTTRCEMIAALNKVDVLRQFVKTSR